MDNYAADILGILDDAAQNFVFPMLDNGYFYLAAARLSLFRSSEDWGMVFETFGFSPRAGLPDLTVTTFSNKLGSCMPGGAAISSDAPKYYDQRFYHPIDSGDWIDPDDNEKISLSATLLPLRGHLVPFPKLSEYIDAQITCEDVSQPYVFEFCRALANLKRNDVLATVTERAASLSPELQCILTLEDWHHPDVVCSDELPSKNTTFRQLTDVLISGDISNYKPSKEYNTHWSNWPDGGTL
jgi:hypothetical protein